MILTTDGTHYFAESFQAAGGAQLVTRVFEGGRKVLIDLAGTTAQFNGEVRAPRSGKIGVQLSAAPAAGGVMFDALLAEG